jgi:hypothetical protein
MTISPPSRPNHLRLNPSRLNLTALNGNYAGPEGQSFVARRQQHTLFAFSIDLAFFPSRADEEAGVTAFLTQNHHLDLGVVLLPRNASTMDALPGYRPAETGDGDEDEEEEELVPMARFRGESYVPVPKPVVVPLPVEAWWPARTNTTSGGSKSGGRELTVTLEIKAANATHYSFSVGPAGRRSAMQTVLYASNEAVSWGFTGEFVFCVAGCVSKRILLVFADLSSEYRYAAGHLQHKQWRKRDDAGLLLELAVHSPGAVPRLRTIKHCQDLLGI